MATLPIPEFIPANAAEIEAQIIAFFEGLTGRKMKPADVETLVFKVLQFREVVHRNDDNDAALQNLVAFATFPILDYLGQNVGVLVRNPAFKAKTTIKFLLNTGHPNMVIQAGTRVSHPNGQPVFAVIEDTFVLSSIDEVDIICESVEEGTRANGFAPGTITELLDSFSDFDSCENIDTTAGGSEEETDEQLRERIYLAPAAFSNCGPIEAYRFHALSAHPSIIDVKVAGPQNDQPYPPAGTVAIYPLTGTTPTPTAVLDAVMAKCSKIDKIPTTDTVEVVSPTPINYSIQVDLTLFNGADDETIVSEITNALNLYKEQKGTKLGIDIVREQITALCVIDGVYKPNLVLPAADIDIPDSSFGNCTGIVVNIAGYTNG